MWIARFCLVLIATLASAWAGQEIKQEPGETVVPGEIVIRVKPGANLTGVLRSLNVTANTVATADNLPVQVIQVPESMRQTLSTILANHPEIEYVEPHRIRMASGVTPNDASFAAQWWLSKVQATGAWSLLGGRMKPPVAGARVRIAVLDTGADCTHPDFSNTVGGSTDSAQGGQFSFALSRAFVPTTIANPACPWQDDHGHGTHVAGILAAATNNAAGVAALAYPAELVIFKVLDKTGAGSDMSIANAITAAADSGARIISLSLGGPGYSQLVQDAVDYAWSRNSLVVAATGNGNTDTLYFPAGANYVLGVGATDSADVRAYFSNFGFGVDVMAPGVSILSTYPGNAYQSLSGTSMATPLISSAAGLIANSTAVLASDVLAQRIEMSADSTLASGGWDNYNGYGRVNAARALNGALRATTLGGLTGQVVNASGTPVTGAQVSIGGIVITTSSTGLFRFGNLTAGAGTLTVNSSGSPAWVHNIVIPQGADSAIQVSLGVAAGDFQGSVTSAGAALAGAVVQALQSGIVKASGVTDANGQFSMTVPAGTYDLRSSAFQHCAFTRSAQAVTANGKTFVSMPMLPLGAVAGTVVDDEKAPLAGVQITVDNGAYSAGAVTNAKGEFVSLGVPSGSYTVSASQAGYLEKSTAGVGVTDGSSTINNFQLLRGVGIPQVTLTRNSIGGGAVMTGNQIVLSAPAGPGGAVVTLTSSNPAVAQLPATITVPAGTTQSAVFNITTKVVTGNTSVIITASLNGLQKTASFSVTPFAITYLVLSPAQLGGGADGTSNRIYLNSIAPPGGAVVQVTSSNPAVARVPATVTVLEGESTSPVFTITTSSVATSTPVTITAYYAGASKTANLTVAPTALASFSVSPLLVTGGKPITTTSLTLDSPAPAGGAVVLLSSSGAAITPPASVIVPAGAKTLSNFPIPTASVSANASVTVNATYAGVTKSVAVSVKPLNLYILSVSTAPVSGGKSLTATVTLEGPAPAAGAAVKLVSANPAVASPPAEVIVAAGATVSPSFLISTSAVTTSTPVVITAGYGDIFRSVTVTVKPTALNSLVASTTPVAGGKAIASAYVTLDGPAPPAGTVVSLSSASPLVAAPPASVTIPAGASTSPYFSITTTSVAAVTPVTVTASYGGVSKTVTVTVKPTALNSLVAPTTPVAGGKAIASAYVTLDGPAPPAGTVVSLSSASPLVAAPPASVTIPGGASTSPYFSITTTSVAAVTPVTVTASYGGVSKTVTVTVKPNALLGLSVAIAPIAGGKSMSATVTLEAPAGASGAVVTLTSANPAVASVPTSVTVPAGATVSPSFLISTSSVTTSTPVVITASYGDISRSATATVKPNALSWLTVSTTPIAGGMPLNATVTLEAPAGPSGAVVTLTSTNAGAANPPASVAIAAGATVSPVFTISTSAVTTSTPVAITASYGGVSKAVTVTVKPAAIYGLSLSASLVSGGKPANAKVTLDGPAPAAGAVVTMTSSNPAAAVSQSGVIVPAGATSSAYFTVTTTPVTVATAVTITATYAGVSKSWVLNVKPADLLSFSANPVSIKGGLTIGSASVTLDGPAPAGGLVVALSSSNVAAMPAASVTVAAGATSAVFTIPTKVVAAATSATVTAVYAGVNKQVTVTINP